MTKIKISFEVTDTWDRGEFRELIRMMLTNPQSVCNTPNNDFELFIISNDMSTAYIQSVANTINAWFPDQIIFDTNHTIIVAFRQDKVNAIQSNAIDIHFDADQLTVAMVEVLPTEAVLVRSLQDRFNVRQQYITDFYNILKNVISEKNKPVC